MIVIDNRVSKRAEFNLRKDENSRKAPVYKGGVSERQSS
jgi:hypothetical protein